MKKLVFALATAVAMLAFSLASCSKEPQSPVSSQDTNAPALTKASGSTTTLASVSVFFKGLNNPRGLRFGPDGYLYVAEGGGGGTNSTVGQCTQVPAPIGPYTGSAKGSRISRISPAGVRTTVVDSLPSSSTSAATGSLTSGVADVEFIDKTLYALIDGAGCSHGVPSIPNGVIRVNKNGTWTPVADLSSFWQSHPVAHPEPDDFEPDGTPYSMVRVGGDLFVVEPNHGELDKVDPKKGKIERVIDISASQGHIVPATVAFSKGHFFVGNLNTFPIIDGSSNVFKIDKNGHKISIAAPGFTTVLGVTFDRKGRLYVLENTTGGHPNPTPGFGMIVRVNKNGPRDTIATGLSLPTAMTFGPDGKLYVSNWGFGPPSSPAFGGGEILRIDVPGVDGGHNDGDDDTDVTAGVLE